MSAEEIVRGATAAAKSLRWLANNLPDNGGEDETSKLSRCIHLYCKAGADSIDALMAQLAASQQETRAAVESLKRKCMDELAAVKCICDIETYLELGSAKYIKKTIDSWRGPQEAGEGARDGD